MFSVTVPHLRDEPIRRIIEVVLGIHVPLEIQNRDRQIRSPRVCRELHRPMKPSTSHRVECSSHTPRCVEYSDATTTTGLLARELQRCPVHRQPDRRVRDLRRTRIRSAVRRHSLRFQSNDREYRTSGDQRDSHVSDGEPADQSKTVRR